MKFLRNNISSVEHRYLYRCLCSFRLYVPVIFFLCAVLSCAADNSAALLADLKAGNYDFFLRADAAAYRQVKKMGRASAYYVGLHLQRNGYEDAARFYFKTGEKLYESPFNRLCRTALYETGSSAERLESVQKRLAELAEPFSLEDRQEKELLDSLRIRLLLQMELYQQCELTPEYLCRTALFPELVQAFSQFSAGMPVFLYKLAESRVLVFEKRYAEAWLSIQAAFDMKYRLKEIAFSALLSDMGKAGIYGAEDKAAAALFFEELAEKIRNTIDREEELTADMRRMMMFYAFFYAARCRSRAGAVHLERAVRLFEQASVQAVSDEDFDSALWYYLDTLRTLSRTRFLEAVVRTAPTWKNPAWYTDLTDSLQVSLTAAQDWKGLNMLYTALTAAGLAEQQAAAAYILVRSGFLEKKEAQRLLKEISRGNHDSLYYRMLAGYQQGESGFSFYPRKALRRTHTDTALPAQEAEPYIDGLLHFGLYTLVYPAIAAVYPSIPAEKVEAVSAVLESESLYADSIRVIALALKNQEKTDIDSCLRRLYPRPWRPIVKKYAETYGVPEYLLYALIRSESFFQPEAVSHAGAVGLTQLMPPTAADIAKKLKIGSYDLKEPEINIRFGAYYLAEMIRRLDGRIMPACFAYNAGISRVRSWQRAAQGLPDDLFLESLAYAETRGYGRKILTAAAVYGRIYYGEKTGDIVRYFFPNLSFLE